jgi:hypothetical protein
LNEFEVLVEDVKGHALTLNLLGTFLRDAHGGDIRRRDLIRLSEANAEGGSGHAFRVMDAYVQSLADEGERGQRALTLLSLLGFFDRPATAGCLEALWTAPVIEGLTEPLAGLSETQRNLALRRLEHARLLTVNRDAASQLLSLDAHPLIREYFAVQLKAKQPDAWQAGHKRLYEYLRDSTKEGDQPTLEDLQPLYQAVAHGCQAGLQEEARAKVYRDRIQRGQEAYSARKLGAFGSDLGAVACFFEAPWSLVSATLTEAAQSWLLNEAATRLHALGRLTEALEPMRVSGEMDVNVERWKGAANSYSNLSELELTLGAVAGAVEDAEQSVIYADRSGDAFRRMANRTSHADALHQASRRTEAEERFREAEQMQAERQPSYPMLYSLAGFHYCDLLLATPESASWALMNQKAESALQKDELVALCRAVTQRTTQTIRWVSAQNWLLDIALEHLTLGRAAFYEVLVSQAAPSFSLAADHLSGAVSRLRRAGQQQYLPLGLLTHAWFSFAQASERRQHDYEEEAIDCVNHAKADLEEAYDIAARGPMPLFLADIHLHRARLFWREKEYPWESPAADLAAARKLIEKHGYWRRKEELEDAYAALSEGGR